MKLPHLALRDLFWLVATVGLALALWLERSREPEVLYLHLYSNRYDIHSMRPLPPPPRAWQRIATISVVSGTSFYADIPSHYEPAMHIEGKMVRRGSFVGTDFTIDLADVALASLREQKTPVRLNSLHDFGEPDFKFAISVDAAGPTDPSGWPRE